MLCAERLLEKVQQSMETGQGIPGEVTAWQNTSKGALEQVLDLFKQ